MDTGCSFQGVERPKHAADYAHYIVKLRGALLVFRKCLHVVINPLNAELNPICYLLALLGAHHFLHVSRIRVNTSAHCSGRKQVNP